MNVNEYCLELLRLNATQLSSFRNARYYAHVLTGLSEELLEFYCKIYVSADNASDLILETGDVLAYTTLVMASMRRDSVVGIPALAVDVANILEPHIMGDYPVGEHITFAEVPLLCLGRAKRWFREGTGIQLYDVGEYFNATLTALNGVFTNQMSLPPVTFSEVAQQNIMKLVGRVERQTLFVGDGDTR